MAGIVVCLARTTMPAMTIALCGNFRANSAAQTSRQAFAARKDETSTTPDNGGR
jgi:hypothetical protein